MTTAPQKKRNWFWLIPVGCLGALVLLAAIVGVIVALVFGTLKSSDVYRQALAKAQANPTVTTALGAPVHDGWFVSGSVKISGGSGDADLSIPLRGARKRGTLYAVAQRVAGQWEYSALSVEVEGVPERVNLLLEPAVPAH